MSSFAPRKNAHFVESERRLRALVGYPLARGRHR
jgi:hypothetical protein